MKRLTLIICLLLTGALKGCFCDKKPTDSSVGSNPSSQFNTIRINNPFNVTGALTWPGLAQPEDLHPGNHEYEVPKDVFQATAQVEGFFPTEIRVQDGESYDMIKTVQIGALPSSDQLYKWEVVRLHAGGGHSDFNAELVQQGPDGREISIKANGSTQQLTQGRIIPAIPFQQFEFMFRSLATQTIVNLEIRSPASIQGSFQNEGGTETMTWTRLVPAP